MKVGYSKSEAMRIVEQNDFLRFTENDIPEYMKYYFLMKDKVSSWLQPVNILIWDNFCVPYYKIVDGFFCIVCVEEDEEKNGVVLTLTPVGDYENNNCENAYLCLTDLFKQFNIKLHMLAVPEWLVPILENSSSFQGEYILREEKSDYVYTMDNLRATMDVSKNRYYAKRFVKDQNPEVILYNPDMLEECLGFLDTVWCENSSCDQCVVGCMKDSFRRAMEMREALNLKTYIIYSEGQIVAYVGFIPFEDELIYIARKARRDLKGFTEFSIEMLLEKWGDTHKYMNYEEDMGIEGLRKHKRMLAAYELRNAYEAEIWRK